MPRTLCLIVFSVLQSIACRSAPPKLDTVEAASPRVIAESQKPARSPEPAKPTVSCGDSLIDLDRWMSDGLLVIGEQHGTQEIPRIVAQTVCAVSASGKTTWLTLEIPRDEQPRLDAFLTTGDEAALLEGPFWRRDYQDGRSSEGMLGLLREARRLRTAGRDIRLLTMDVPSTGDPAGQDRDSHMAAIVAQKRAEAPEEPMVLLVGNIHASRKVKIPRPLVWRLAKQGVALKTLLVETSGGTAWMCGSSCGPVPVSGKDFGPESRVIETPEAVTWGYDALLYLGALSPASPAWRK
ncbi:hypothetical protein [Hyalangium versicolor]|uniref:hypothetical protein n=1 Tax=Hyalangium versicolor TaxID=2861190 RepID=UPI001CCEB466|nr:hypothetical protein [Hyalangium versicolor]